MRDTVPWKAESIELERLDITAAHDGAFDLIGRIADE